LDLRDSGAAIGQQNKRSILIIGSLSLHNAAIMSRVAPLHVSQQLIDDPLPMWRRYARDYHHTICDYDIGARGHPNVLTEGEAWRSRIIGSRLTRSECDQVVQRALCSPWGSVPADADLVDADPAEPDGLFVDAVQLYWSFTSPQRIRGVAVAKIHKILHPKRPDLYPILDLRVKRLYRPGAAAWIVRMSHLGEVTLADSPPYWAAFRDDLVRNHEALRAYQRQMAEDSDERVRMMANLTCLRLQDVIAWMIAVSTLRPAIALSGESRCHAEKAIVPWRPNEQHGLRTMIRRLPTLHRQL
jgi:hypothetical protein